MKYNFEALFKVVSSKAGCLKFVPSKCFVCYWRFFLTVPRHYAYILALYKCWKPFTAEFCLLTPCSELTVFACTLHIKCHSQTFVHFSCLQIQLQQCKRQNTTTTNSKIWFLFPDSFLLNRYFRGFTIFLSFLIHITLKFGGGGLSLALFAVTDQWAEMKTQKTRPRPFCFWNNQEISLCSANRATTLVCVPNMTTMD